MLCYGRLTGIRTALQWLSAHFHSYTYKNVLSFDYFDVVMILNFTDIIVIEKSKRGKGYAKEGLKLLCNYAKEQGVKSLYDNFEIDRENTLKVFENVGFKVIEKTTWKKFNKEVEGVIVKIEL